MDRTFPFASNTISSVFFHFPPSEGPNYKVIAKEYELYDLNRRGLRAEDFASWVENVARIQIKITRPVDYSVYLVYAAALRNKQLWMFASLGFIVLFCSGFMWNQIRGAPYTGAKDGKPQLVAGGFQSQYVLESQIAGILYAISAFLLFSWPQRFRKSRIQSSRDLAYMLASPAFYCRTQ
ncbi:hypothetical protein BC829DRAFT_238153 [Chytridium lagenaria]|nr:hypothetical protein BC829DRAFT_238153 [Chytridium lagenaria]